MYLERSHRRILDPRRRAESSLSRVAVRAGIDIEGRLPHGVSGLLGSSVAAVR
jgi:hypothetical protein